MLLYIHYTYICISNFQERFAKEMAEAERQAQLQEAAHRGHNGHIPSSMAVASAASASAAAASVAGRGHQHRRRSHEVRSSHLGSYVNGEAVEAAVDTVDLLGKVFKFITRVRLL